jgi:hypothetical protein
MRSIDAACYEKWWEGELERGYVVHKARRGLEVPATWQAPGAPVPAYLRARAQRNKPVPQVQLRGLGSSGGRVTRGAAKRLQEQGGEGPCEGEKDATLKYVMHDLAPELYIELMAGFH